MVKWDAQKSQVRVYKQSLRLGLQKDKFTLMNPLVRPWYDSANFFVVTHTPLVIYTPDMGLAPGLAESWKISPDGKAVTFLIRGNARWSDGKPVTVQDAEFSYEYWKKHKLYAQGTFLDAFLDRVEVTGQRELKMVFKEPVAALFLKSTAASLYIIPQHVWSKVEDPRTYDGPDAMVGCGPFVFERYDPATQTVYLRANEDYFAGKPLVPAIQWRYFETLDALLLALQKGEIDAQMDYVNNPGGAYANALKRTKGLVVEEIPALGVRPLLYFGFRQYPTNLREFREAVSLAIDYQLLLNAVCAGYGELPGQGFTPPGIPGYNPALPRHRHDPEQAKRILDTAGFVDRDGDGLRETPQGEKLRIPVTTQAGVAELVRAAEIVSLNLKRIGLDAFVEALESTVARNKAYTARDYHLLVWRISPYGVFAYPGGYADFTDAPGLYGTCKDPELLKIVEQIEYAPTPVEQEDAVRGLQAFVARELPAIALVWRKEIVPHSDRWTGWVPMVGYHVCNYWTWYNLEPTVK
ncbi:MAG: ABC transporter substrate-binding protein [Desulfotomaculales bacterium]